ncbi:MAG: tetratricopeptide repeat protein [Sulfuriferula sp.]|nr:tetratricopeptide repeat protein [Sulfuriferula sp.]
MPQDSTPTNSVADWLTTPARPRLITPLNLTGLVVAVSAVLFLLYPQQRISQQLSTSNQVDAVSLQYMRSLLTTEPDNHTLRLQLAQAYTKIGQYDLALKTLRQLYTNTQPQWREAAYLTQIDILSKIAFAAPANSTLRKEKLAQLHTALQQAAPHIYQTRALAQFAQKAEAIGDIQLAELSINKLIRTNKTATLIDHAARLALANGHYLHSAQYSWQAMQLSETPADQRRYLLQALDTLQSGGIGHIGLDWVQQLPPAQWQTPDTLYKLTKLALASNRPAQADAFALQLTGLNSSHPARFIPAYADLAYTAMLGNRDLTNAIKLAQLAVANSPNNATWRERLAHVAEWNNQPQLALEQWHWLATHQGTESAWQAWMRLAGGLFDYAAQIIGLEHNWQRSQHDDKYARKIVQTYEYLGQPEKALVWLNSHADEYNHPELLLLSAELAARMGQDANAITRYRRYLLNNVAQPNTAVNIAALMQRIEQYEEAFTVLDHSRPLATPNDKLFWLNLGELAWRLQHDEQAIVAYRILSDAPDAEPYQTERLVQALKRQNPRLAAQTAQQYWVKTGHLSLFMNTADIYAELGDWPAVQRLYQLTNNAKWQHYDNDLRFVSVRAEMYKHTGDLRAAERDYRFLIKRYPTNNGIKEAYLWLLLDTRQFSQLDTQMQQWTPLLANAPSLWDVFAAGYLSQGKPNQALALYNRMAKSHLQDELWMLNYAVTLEAGGQPDLAWQVRRQIWQQHLTQHKPKDWLNTRANAKDIERLRLLLLNDPQIGQGILWQLLRTGSTALKQNSQFVELATVWLNDKNQNDAIHGWLLRQYAHWLNTPLGVQISDALTNQDHQAAAALLEHDGILLYDKMNLNHLAGRTDNAADLAFIAMDRSRLDESLYQQAAPMLIQNSRTAGIMSKYSEYGSYKALTNEITATNHDIGGLKLDLNLHQTQRTAVDTSVLTRAPHEIGGEIALRQIGNNYINTLKLQFSSGLNTQTGLVFNHLQQIGTRLQLDTQLAYNQTATETAALRIIGRRNQIALDGNYRLDRWTQINWRGEYNQYRSIDGQTLGSGQLLTSTISHTLSEAHPALRARVTGTAAQYQSANTTLTGLTASLIPAGQPNTAGYFMPQSMREVAAYISIGDAIDSRQPAHDLEYLAEIGMFYNNIAGTGIRANAGVATRVIGADKLQLFTRYDQAPSGQGKSTLETGLGYHLHY